MQATYGTTFSMGDVASTTSSLIGRNFVPFAILSFLAALPQAFLLNYSSSMLAPTDGGGINTAVLYSANFWLVYLAMSLVSLVIGFVLHAALTYSTVMDLSRRPISIVAALMTGVRATVPLFLIGILGSLGVVVGFVLLIFPGFMLLSAWIVVVPSYIVERPGVFGAFGRSAALTRGHRWSIFGLLFVFYVAVIMVDLVGRPLSGLPIFSNGVRSLPIGFIMLTTVLRMASLMVLATGTAVIYYLLRAGKEGVGPADLATVFE